MKQLLNPMKVLMVAVLSALVGALAFTSAHAADITPAEARAIAKEANLATISLTPVRS